MNLGDDIRNYYEQLVLDYFHAQELYLRYDDEFMADLCCLVLNKLPPRYIRNAVDMAFFLSSQERAEMDKRVAETVEESLTFLNERVKKEEAE